MPVQPAVSQDFSRPTRPMTPAEFSSPESQAQYLNNAYSDPKLMAWKRAQGASDAVARAEAASAINSARTAQGNLPQEYADMLSSGLRKISEQFENTGMWSSSNRLRNQNEEQGRLQGQMLGQRNAYQDTINSAGTSLAKQLAQGQMEGVDQQFAAADRVATSQAQAGINPFQHAAAKVRAGMQGSR